VATNVKLPIPLETFKLVAHTQHVCYCMYI